MIAEDLILRVKEENNIVDVISEVTRLKRTGRNYVGLCPFHNEKTPSFTVSPDKQIFKCFGCGEAGNVITFVMKTKNIPFPEAVKMLADRANIDFELNNGDNKKYNDKRNKLYKINVEAARYFFHNLMCNKSIKKYFIDRGITEKTMKKFGLGYSLNSWHELIYYLKNKGYTELDMIEAGLILKSKNNTHYDRFRNRVMFPVFDYRGRVIGFGGRVLDDSKPKYLNSPETEVFKKGINLYGLNFALKNHISDTIVIVEGYMDCISLHQRGITNVVASLGTALTINQAKLLKRYVKKVIISYDADIAGQAATLRGLQILKKEGFDIKVLTVPDGKDPDEFIRAHGKEAFEELMKKSLPFIDYRLNAAKKGMNLSNKDIVIHYAKKVIPILKELDPVERDVYIKKVSEETGINEQAIYDMLNRNINKNNKNHRYMNIIDDNRQKLYLEPAYIKAERVLLKLMIEDKKNTNFVVQNITPEDMVLSSHKKIYDLILQNINLSIDELSKFIEVNCVDVESSKEFVKIEDVRLAENEDDYINVIKDCIRQIKKYRLEESKKSIMNEIKKYESEGLVEESIKLARKIVDIQKEISRITGVEGGHR
ncbi:DNA primase [Haloimpatiens sp. FM7330]|uniref:DNA primase n=1 Tax=Haloimpatiens sp. FM7330 TaxID=3298610 RepID=UPI0036285F8F